MMFPIGNIVKGASVTMGTLAERLREERTRLALKQEEMAAAAGLNRTAQIRYEKGERAPDADYLAAIAALGVDVRYLLTGVPTPAIAGDEAELLRRYRGASPEVRTAILGALGVTAIGGAQGKVVITGGEQGQVIAGDAHQQAVNISVGGKKRGATK